MRRLGVMVFVWGVLFSAPGFLFASPIAENERVALMRASQASGGALECARLRVCCAGQPAVAPGAPPQMAALWFFPGLWAPPADRAGLLGAARLARMIVGLESVPEALAAQWAGNKDGQLDVADVVDAVNRLLP